MKTLPLNSPHTANLTSKIEGQTLFLELSGDWLAGYTEDITQAQEELNIQIGSSASSFNRIVILSDSIADWDIALLSFLNNIAQNARNKGISFEASSLNTKARKLLDLALAVPPRTLEVKVKEDSSFLELVGETVLRVPAKYHVTASFLKEVGASLGRFLRGKSGMSRRDFWQCIQECGVDALPIVSLTSLLLGLILAFVGAIQLRMFGAEVYIASLVGLSMVRVMGALLTGIVLSGRTGANFAAILGTMQVNEEIDALVTFGISPYDFLVLPRLLALTLMTPLLAIYADLMGIIGGFLVGILMLDISPNMYIENTLEFMSLSYFWIGLLHAFVFGIVIALAGCYQGIRCGRSAEAVGQAATSAVVNSLVGIIVATSILTVVLTMLGY